MVSEGDEVVYRTHFKFNSVYLIESLPSGDAKTGETLYDTVIYPQTRSLDQCFTNFRRVHGESDLLLALAEIRNNAKEGNHKPILHIEAHGDEDGIQLADGTTVEWRTLATPFAAINEACQFNLTVVAISCKGWFLTGSLIPTDRAPVAFVIGPPDNMTAEDLLEATTRFYETFVKTIDFNESLAAMNEGADYDTWLIKPATAEVLFCRVFRQYEAEVCSTSNLQERENRLVADVVRAQSLDLLQSSALRTDIRRHISDHEWWYDHFRERFMMLDLFPANRERFGLSYARCMPRTIETREDNV